MKEYDPKQIEKKWQKEWEQSGLYTTPNKIEGKENEYVLVEFAYPSGNLHVGHWYAFAVPDIYARYRRMLGKNVLYPMGFDAFGLPAENAAIKNNVNPSEWTFSNIDYMRKQLRSMGASFDWSREVITASPEYYRWTQYLFLKFFEKGLAYQSETPVNWCPGCKTVLANEQVIAGECERCGSKVLKRNMLQWNLRITDYADRLIDDLTSLDWPKHIKDSQINWIGRSEGAEIDFQLTTNNLTPLSSGGARQLTTIKVFTTRPDTIFGATFLAVAPEVAIKLFDNDFGIKSATERENKEKLGVDTGYKAINPANGEEIPIWVVNYVSADYGTGAIMCVPADDERDREFAEKYKLPVLEGYKKAGFEDYGEKVTKYKLRDWVVSRQRYWGCPIPIIHCKDCGAVPVPEKDLPVILPEVLDYLPGNDGKSPLSKVEEWVNTKCPKCGGNALRETDTLDTFVDSSWYFLRYCDPTNDKEFASKEMLQNWMPVNFYSGGAEHTTMHLLYSRFFHKVLFDINLVNESEPYRRRMNRGLIMGTDNQKMSKSRGNVVDPDDYVSRLGADTVRTYLAFIGPYNEVGSYPWNPDAAVGVRRFLERVWKLSEKISEEEEASESTIDPIIKKVSDDISSMKMNTAVSALMILVNSFSEKNSISRKDYETILLLLAPFAPHITEELWHALGHETSIHLATWPTFDESKIIKEIATYAVQVNSKVRATLDLALTADEDEVKAAALALPEVGKWLSGQSPSQIIVVKGRVVNIVI
ncbi:MAG: leucine--tRNA ligase [Parcubacteria group bacterium]